MKEYALRISKDGQLVEIIQTATGLEFSGEPKIKNVTNDLSGFIGCDYVLIDINESKLIDESKGGLPLNEPTPEPKQEEDNEKV